MRSRKDEEVVNREGESIFPESGDIVRSIIHYARSN